MPLILALIAFALIVAGIYYMIKHSVPIGIVLIILGVIVFLLRFTINDSTDGGNHAEAFVVALMMQLPR